MAIIGTAHVQIRADDKYFESDIRAATRRIKNVVIQLKADVDLTKASKKIRDLRYRITSKDAVLTVDANVVKAEAKMAKLLAKFSNSEINVKANAQTTEAIEKLTELNTTFARTTSTISANADTTAANAKLGFAARPRVAFIKTLVDPQTSAALKGIFHTITGTLDGAKIRSVLSGIAANFEGIAFKVTGAITALGALSAAALNATASLLSVAGDMTQVIGLVALMPAGIFMLTTVLKANKMAWKGFGDASLDNSKKANEALAKLPPEAQKAALAIRKVRGEIQKPVQKAFWKEMGTSLQDMIKVQLPSMIKGMSMVGSSWGRFIKGGLDTIKGLGDFNDVFDNVAVSIDNMIPGLKGAIEGLADFVGIGSTYLPAFGTWLGDLGTKFGAFAEEAMNSGKMTEWMDTGIARLQEMGSVVKSTAGIFSGFTQAARKAGAPGLTDMAASMRNIRDIVQGEPFQSRLATVLEGARDGADAMGESFGELSEFVGDSAGSIRLFLEEAGKVTATVFTSIKTLFDGTGLGSGLMTAMGGLDTALKIMQPGFADLGSAIGHLGEIAAEVFEGIAPGLNMVFDTVDQSIGAMKQGILDALPVFNTFIQALMAVVQGPIVALATGIGNALTAFSELPGAIQVVMMSLGLLLLLRGPLMKLFGGFGQMVARETAYANSNLNKVIGGAQQMRGGVADAFSTMGASIKNTMAATSQGFGKIFSPLIGHAQEAKTALATAAQQIGAGFKQGMNLGPHLSDVKKGFSDLRTNVGQTTSGMVTEMRGKVSDLVKAIAPVGGALHTAGAKVGQQASQMHNHLAPARAAFAALPTAAYQAGALAATNIGSGFKSIGAGVLGALGGGWGIALAGATVALGLYAAEQAKTKAKVDALADSLDQQTGAFSDKSKTLLTKDIIDLDANAVDDFFRMLSGNAKNSIEVFDSLGISSEKVTDAIANPNTRGDYLATWDAISKNANGSAKDFEGLAGKIDTTGAALEGLSGFEIQEMNNRLKKAAEVAEKAEKRVRDLATATGKNTIQAAMLAKNYDTLESSTSSVSEKFAALKQNIDIASDGMGTARGSARDFAESIFDLEDDMKGMGKEYDKWGEGTTKFSQSFKDTLLDADGMFSTTTRGAVAFSKSMDTARDAVLQSGASELKRLQDTGVSFEVASAGALGVMEKGAEKVRQALINAGIEGPQLEQMMGQLKLNPDDLRAAVAIDTKDAEGKLMRFGIMREAVIQGNWTVALAATSDEVKNEILKTEIYKKAYEEGGWTAVVDIINEGGPKIEDFMLDLVDAQTAEDVRKVIDVEAPGAKVLGDVSTQIENYNAKVLNPKNLEALDGVTPVADAAGAKLREFTLNYPIDPAQLSAVDSTGPAVQSALTNMDIPDSEAFLYGIDGTAPGTQQAQVTMGGLQDVSRFLFSEDKAKAGLNAAQGTMNTLSNVSRWLQALNETDGGKRAAQATIDLLRGKEVKLTADDQASGIVSKVDKAQIGNKSFNIMGVLSGVSQAVRSALGMAHGGILGGDGVQTFANGGILNSVKASGVKAYANGGMENHVAQIARGQFPVRIWAEPETGGEAYIPLHKGKRKRSLDILRQVMDEFGLSQYATFADGGFNKASAMQPSVVTSRYTTTSASIDRGTRSSESAGTNIQLTVNPSQGLSEEQIGEAAMKELYWQLSSR